MGRIRNIQLYCYGGDALSLVATVDVETSMVEVMIDGPEKRNDRFEDVDKVRLVYVEPYRTAVVVKTNSGDIYRYLVVYNPSKRQWKYRRFENRKVQFESKGVSIDYSRGVFDNA